VEEEENSILGKHGVQEPVLLLRASEEGFDALVDVLLIEGLTDNSVGLADDGDVIALVPCGPGLSL
jgi:hypothetical protein